MSSGLASAIAVLEQQGQPAGTAGLALATERGPHVLRHSLATMFREQGYDLPAIAAVLGHSSVDVTGRYTLASATEAAATLEHFAIDT